MKQGTDEDIEDYFAMQERKTSKVSSAPAAPNCVQAAQLPPVPPPRHIENVDMMVEESPGQDGLDTIVEKVRKFWDR